MNRNQRYRMRRAVEMIREGTDQGALVSSPYLAGQLGVSQRTVYSDLDVLRDLLTTARGYSDV